MEMPVLRHDDEPGSSPQRISQPLRARYRAEPDYTLPCLPQPCARSPNLHGLLINVREMQPLVLRTVRCGIRQALAPAKPVTNFSDEVASGGRLEQPLRRRNAELRASSPVDDARASRHRSLLICIPYRRRRL